MRTRAPSQNNNPKICAWSKRLHWGYRVETGRSPCSLASPPGLIGEFWPKHKSVTHKIRLTVPEENHSKLKSGLRVYVHTHAHLQINMSVFICAYTHREHSCQDRQTQTVEERESCSNCSTAPRLRVRAMKGVAKPRQCLPGLLFVFLDCNHTILASSFAFSWPTPFCPLFFDLFY